MTTAQQKTIDRLGAHCEGGFMVVLDEDQRLSSRDPEGSVVGVEAEGLRRVVVAPDGSYRPISPASPTDLSDPDVRRQLREELPGCVAFYD